MDERALSRCEKLVSAAEGYITLEMFTHALASLAEIREAGEMAFRVEFLRGDVLRTLERHSEALAAFDRAFVIKPDDVDLLMAMAWCYKRTNQLPRAITSMEQAYRISPKVPVILYNLSCYWSLAGNKAQSLSWLGRALRMDRSLRNLIDDETDFNPLRNDPDFRMIVSAVSRQE